MREKGRDGDTGCWGGIGNAGLGRWTTAGVLWRTLSENGTFGFDRCPRESGACTGVPLTHVETRMSRLKFWHGKYFEATFKFSEKFSTIFTCNTCNQYNTLNNVVAESRFWMKSRRSRAVYRKVASLPKLKGRDYHIVPHTSTTPKRSHCSQDLSY